MIEFNERTILVIDDEMMILRDIEDVLLEMGVGTVALANSSTEAFLYMENGTPDLIICDVNLQEKHIDGIQLIQKLQNPNALFDVIFITAHTELHIAEKAQLTQPANYIIKPFDDNQLRITVSLALKNYIENHQSDVLINTLTKTEIKILELIKEGKTSREIANELFVTEKTIKNHRYNICKKLNLPSESNSLMKWVINKL